MGQGGSTLYMCRRTCQAKLQQGVVKANDLKRIVNELRIQHTPNQSTSSQAEIQIIIPGHLVKLRDGQLGSCQSTAYASGSVGKKKSTL